MARNRQIRRSEIYMLLIVIQIISRTTAAETHTLNHCDDSILSDEYQYVCECIKEDQDNLYRVNCNGQLLLSDTSVPLFNVSNQNLPFTIRVSHLDLSNNDIDEIPDTFFNAILHIDTLLLSNNSLFKFPDINVTTITELDLSNNHLTHLNITDIEDLMSLKTLKIMNNNIVNLTSSVLSDISNSDLEELDLSQNEIANIPLDFIARLKKLSKLNLSKNAIFNVRKVINDSNIRLLDLSYNKLSLLPVEAFRNIKQLESLSIANNDLESVQGVWFPDTLTEIDLSNCAIKELFECDFHNVYDLSTIHLHGNNLSCDCHMLWLKEQNADLGNAWMCLANQTKLVPFKTVPAEDFVCNTMAHEQQYCAPKVRYEEFVTDLDVSVEDEEIVVTWKLSQHHRLSAIKIRAKTDDKTLESPVLHISNSEYRISGIKSRVTYNVCLYAYENTTMDIEMKCQEISDTDLSYLIGILAGAIFLIPCVIALICIFRADKRKQVKYLLIQGGEDADSLTSVESHKNKKNISVVKQESQTTKKPGSATGRTNISFISDDGTKAEAKRKNSLTNKTQL